VIQYIVLQNRMVSNLLYKHDTGSPSEVKKLLIKQFFVLKDFYYSVQKAHYSIPCKTTWNQYIYLFFLSMCPLLYYLTSYIYISWYITLFQLIVTNLSEDYVFFICDSWKCLTIFQSSLHTAQETSVFKWFLPLMIYNHSFRQYVILVFWRLATNQWNGGLS
jgi:hypothetical protein